jgi:hypothetical protein
LLLLALRLKLLLLGQLSLLLKGLLSLNGSEKIVGLEVFWVIVTDALFLHLLEFL